MTSSSLSLSIPSLLDSITIWYAPLPQDDKTPPSNDESSSSSAAEEYADRIRRILVHHQQEKDEEELQVQPSLHMLKDPDQLLSFLQSLSLPFESKLGDQHNNNNNNNNSKLIIFVISCDADGSVHRSIRKVIRSLKQKEESSQKNDDNQKKEEQDSSSTLFMLLFVLLGHAKCHNSAIQMKDTIFATGRRFYKAILSSSSSAAALLFSSNTNASNHAILQHQVLELQVELEDPESTLDPWVQKQLETMTTAIKAATTTTNSSG